MDLTEFYLILDSAWTLQFVHGAPTARGVVASGMSVNSQRWCVARLPGLMV